MFVTLFHGQSAIARGFSINKQFWTKYLKTSSLIALKIEDHMSSNGQSPHSIETWKDMLENAKDTSRCYKEKLLEQRKEKGGGQKALKGKVIDDEIKAVKTNWWILLAEVVVRTCEAVALALKIDKENNFSLLFA